MARTRTIDNDSKDEGGMVISDESRDGRRRQRRRGQGRGRDINYDRNKDEGYQ